jgi:peptide/nickel transport system ATP-binding protein
MSRIVDLRNLKVYFYDQKDKRFVRAVEDVGFQVGGRSILGMVGESGSGKTVTARSMMGLVTGEPGVIGGEFYFRPGTHSLQSIEQALSRGVNGDRSFREGELVNLFHGLDRYVAYRRDPFTVIKDSEKWLRRNERIMEHVRGRNISMIFQRSLHLFESVRLRTPEEVMNMYAGSLSVGIAQRVVIAIALSSSPSLLIADEPTSGLDTTAKYGIMDLLASLVENMGLTLILISHNIRMVGSVATHLVVMYAGLVVEIGPRRHVIGRKLLGNKHPYTEALLSSMPTDADIKRGRRPRVIRGTVPDNKLVMEGCPYLDRCGYARGKIRKKCSSIRPELIEVSEGHYIRCYLYDR